jgi:tol-pal system protein YbgF
MLGLARSPGGPAAGDHEGRAEVTARPPAGPPEAAARPAKAGDGARGAKAPAGGRSAPGEAARPAKAGPGPREAKAVPAERPPGEASSSRPGKAGSAPPSGTTPLAARALFDRAMESWKKGEMGQAVLDFEELVQTFPSDPLVPAAQFRIGEAYYTVRDFERAALGYRKSVELAPRGKDAPQALLRLGLAYRAQKREADARQAWAQLVRDFPDSDATEEARRALRLR